jgi:tetratricopeptide (TPR) repeat protein
MTGGNADTQPGTAAVAGPDPAAVQSYGEALALLQAGDETQAAARFDALAQQYPDYAGPLVNRAIIHARHNEPEPALALLERAVVVCGDCAAAWNERGILLRQQGRFGEAEDSYLKAIAADPAYRYAHFNLGVLYDLYMKRPQLALEQYARYVELETDPAATGDVDKWIADLRRRTGGVERSAQLEEGP